MKLNTLTKASSVLKEIQMLDEQIIRIDKIALSICDKHQNGSLTFGFEKPKKAIVDEDPEYRGFYNILMPSYKAFGASENQEETHRFEIDEVETMALCGVLIQVKKERRKLLVSQLLELGYTY